MAAIFIAQVSGTNLTRHVGWSTLGGSLVLAKSLPISSVSPRYQSICSYNNKKPWKVAGDLNVWLSEVHNLLAQQIGRGRQASSWAGGASKHTASSRRCERPLGGLSVGWEEDGETEKNANIGPRSDKFTFTQFRDYVWDRKTILFLPLSAF
jgi:hypothetical protein